MPYPMKKFLWSLLEVGETVVIAVVAVFVVRTFIAQPFLVSGASMEQNFHDRDYLLVDELTYRIRPPERGEVVVFKWPGDHKSYYIKRIIGLPGERVVVDDGKVKVTDVEGILRTLDESYLATSFSGHTEATLGAHQYFVMGDNRSFSYDSRNWGPVDRSEIVGLVRVRLWPLNQAMAFHPPRY